MARNNATRRMLRHRMRANGQGSRGTRAGAPRWLQVLAAVFGLFIISVAGAGIAGYGVYQSYAADLKSPQEVIAQNPSGGAQILDRNGKVLYQYVDDRSGLRSPVKLQDISPWMIAATISTEDYSFWSNPGVNPKGLIRAGLETLHLRTADASNTTGGSGITQQLVKNIYIPQQERYQRSYSRKLKEVIYAVELTNRYSKNQILEWYLNQISYGGLYNGVEAAAEGYFGVHAKDLTLPQAAMLAGIPASPAQYDPVSHPDAAVARRNEVLRLMQTRINSTIQVDGKSVPAADIQVNGDGTKVHLTNAAFYLATLAPPGVTQQQFPIEAPHWVFDVIQPQLEQMFGKDALLHAGLRVLTTLNLDLEHTAQTDLNRWISAFEDQTGSHNGALVAIDPRTSEVLTYVGSRDYFRKDIQGNVDNASPANGRSPGSTLKPFTYTAAFERLGWGPGTEILDTPITYKDGNKDFTPANPAHDFHGPISVHDALGNSLNVPAFKTALYVGVPNVVAEYKKFGMTTLGDPSQYGPSVTIGGVDVRLYDVAYAYTVLASGGVMRGVPRTNAANSGDRKLDPVTILQVTRQSDGAVLYPTTPDHRVQVQEQQIVKPQYAYMISSILSDPNAFCLTYGCGALTIGRPWAVKTGASQPFENSTLTGDTWTYGYTPDLVTGVWAGNADNSPVHNILSSSIAYRAVRDFMKDALANTPVSQFQRPPGLSDVDTCTPSGLLANDTCGRKVKNLLPTATAPTQPDNWWSSVKVDIRTGLLANELTPPQFIQQRFGLAIPSTITDPFQLGQAQEWARVLNASVQPTSGGAGDIPVRIDAPTDGARLLGIVPITGKALSPDFISYRIEFGLGNPPLAWTMIANSTTPQPDGGLGLWNTNGLPEGSYTLRLVVTDKTRGELSTFITVNLGPPGNIRVSPTFTPTATPASGGGGGNN
ncbi:MAG TPA: transglycosylase domain-containing protein [Dehalococcoidia bacterium]|nr:transglycosylase domain-containing protein [Dehalococcoidia bacterium]